MLRCFALIGWSSGAWAASPLPDTEPRTANTLGPVDLNGDRKREMVHQTDAGVVVGRTTIPCGSVESPCTLALHDIVPTDRLKELSVCTPQPPSQRSCTLLRPRAAGVVRVPLRLAPQVQARYPGGPMRPIGFATRGDGVLRVELDGPLAPRVERFESVDGRLVHQPESFYDIEARTIVAVQDVELRTGPGASAVAAIAQAGQPLRLWKESGDHPGWYLVQAVDARVGWVSVDVLRPAQAAREGPRDETVP